MSTENRKEQGASLLLRFVPEDAWRKTILAIVLLAALLRLPALASVPPGLFGDEAANGVDALDTLAGNVRLFYTGNFGREGLTIWLVAAAIALFGVDVVAVRLASAVPGIVGIATVPPLAAALWPGKTGRAAGLLAALWLATSFWHLHISRFGERLVLTPLAGGLAVWLFWRAYRQPTPRAWLLAGLALGLNAYAYSVSRFFPVVFLLFWLSEVRRGGWSRDRKALLPFAGGALLAAAPMLAYFATHPQHFFLRARAVGVFWEADLLQLVLRSVAGNLGQFAVRGDADGFFNLAGRPVFTLPTALLALAGLLLCLRRGRQPAERFLLLWLAVMFLPAVLATDKVPSLPRIVGMLPALYLLPALATVEGVGWLRRRWPLPQPVGLALLTVPLVLHAASDLPTYFRDYPRRPQTQEAFEADAVALARWLNTQPVNGSETVYVSLDIYRHPVVMFLSAHSPTSRYFTTPLPHAARWLDARHAVPLPSDTHDARLLAGSSARPPDDLAQWLAEPPASLLLDAPLAVWPVRRDLPFVDLPPVPLLPSLALDGYARLPDLPGGPVLLWRWQVLDAPPPATPELTLQWGALSTPLGVRPLEWRAGDRWATWVRLASPADADGPITLRLLDADGQPLAQAEISLNSAP